MRDEGIAVEEGCMSVDGGELGAEGPDSVREVRPKSAPQVGTAAWGLRKYLEALPVRVVVDDRMGPAEWRLVNPSALADEGEAMMAAEIEGSGLSVAGASTLSGDVSHKVQPGLAPGESTWTLRWESSAWPLESPEGLTHGRALRLFDKPVRSHPENIRHERRLLADLVAYGLRCRRCSGDFGGERRSNQGGTYLCVGCFRERNRITPRGDVD